MINAHLTRQMDLIPTEHVQNQAITIIGCGSLGSFLAMQLVKMGVRNLTLYDGDTVGIENMSCQYHTAKDIHLNKAHALANNLSNLCTEEWYPQAYQRHWTTDDKLTGIVVMAADSMATRRQIWDKAKESLGVKLVIDMRMGAETALMYTMRPHQPVDIKAMEATMYSDADAAQEPCTAKATIYTANMLTGLCAKTIKNIICNQPYPRITLWNIKDDDLRIVKSN